MKRKLLFAVMTLITGAWSLSANAQIVETDMTSQFSNLTNYRNWTGASGYTATNFCPMVTVGGGIGQKQVCERYVSNCNETGDIFYSTVTGLTAGTYKIELYGGAAYTYGRGFSSTAFSTGTWNAGDKIDPPGTGVTLYAQSEGVTYGGEIPIYYATNFPDGAATVTVEGVVVGTSGQIKIGMTKTSTSTNWHVIQLKSVIAQVDLSDLVAAKKGELQAIVNEGSPYASYSADLQTALETAQGYIDTDVSSDATAAQQLISNMEASIATLPALIAVAKNAQSVDGASASNPIVTDFVVNGTFNTAGDIAPWQSTGGFQNQNTASNQQGAFTGNFFENWDPSAKVNKMYQDVANIPNGVYKLSICAFVNTFGGTQYVFANSAQTPLTTGSPTAYEVFVEVTNNAVQIGLEQTTATANWMGIDNVFLTYYGNCTIDEAKFGSLVQQLADLKAQIRAITAVPQALIDADEVTLDSYDPTTFTTAAQYEAAITALQAVLAARQTAETSYAKLTELKGYVTALLAVDYTELVSGAHATLEAASTDESSLTTAAAIDQAYTDLKDATMTYVANADPAAGSQFDLTFLLVNPDLSSFNAWTGGIEGWYTDQSFGTQNFQTMDEGETGKMFMEFWSAGSNATDGFVLYQQLTLPEGTYQMTAECKAGWGSGASAQGGMKNITFSANEVDGNAITSDLLAANEIEFINSIEQSVKIGLKAHAGNTCNWMGIGYVKLYKIPTENTEYAIGVDATHATVEVTVEGAPAAAAKKLDAVNFTVTPDAGSVIQTLTVTYVDGDNNTQTITPTDLGNGAYTFQMPAFDVTITVVASIDKTALAAAIAGAAPYLNEALPTAMMAALNNANTTAQDVYADADATAQEIADATDALNFVVMDVQNVIPLYSAYLELKAYADALVSVESDDDTAQQDLSVAIGTAVTGINAATSADEAESVNAALKAAMVEYATIATPTDGNKFDLTFMLTNPDLTPFYTGEHGVHPDGWATEQADGNYQVIPSEDAANPDGIHKYCYEYWSDPAKDNGIFNLYTTVNLPVGTYQMSCYAFASPNGVEGATNNQVYFYANDTQGSLVTSEVLALQNVEFVNNSTQDVKIGLKSLAGNQYRWMGIGYVQLFKVPAQTFEVGGEEWNPATEGAGDVTITRSINAALNAVVFPFSMTQAEVETYFGEGSTVKIVKSFNIEKEHLSFETREGIQANQPCLLKATQASAAGTIIVPERTIVPATVLTDNNEVTYSGDEVVMYGCYAEETFVPDYGLFVQGGKLVYNEGTAHVDGAGYVYATRGYIVLNGWTPGANGIKGLTIDFDDEATGIAVVENGELKVLDGQAYDLSGRAVKNPTKGLYIIGGKKVFLK
ncbi:MAG: hypothetical protein K5778_04250 [Bacteroidaceae bacterium]|nr:hypothetical protein [Bacteroidaceae bacterium]